MEPEPTFGWSYADVCLATQVLNTLIANLDEKDPLGKHRAKSDYLRYHLCPLFGLIQACLEEIEPNVEHPRRDSWILSLTIIRDSYYRFETKLDKQNSQTTTGFGPDIPIISGTWTWNELSGNIEAIQTEIGDALLDVEWLINLELRSKLEEDVQTLEDLSGVIETRGATIATYRRGLQEALRDVQANEQDCETVQDLFQGSTTEFAQKLIKHRRETRAMSATLQQVQNILAVLAGQLSAQRTRCPSDTGKRQLSQLQTETKKRAAAISRLCQRYDSADEMGSEIVRMIRKLGLPKWQGQASDDEVKRKLLNVAPRLERLYEKFRNRSNELLSKGSSKQEDEEEATTRPQIMTRAHSSPAHESDESIYSVNSASQEFPGDDSHMAQQRHESGYTVPVLRSPRSTSSNHSHGSSEIDEIMPLFALRIPSSTISWPPPPTRSAPPVPSPDSTVPDPYSSNQGSLLLQPPVSTTRTEPPPYPHQARCTCQSGGPPLAAPSLPPPPPPPPLLRTPTIPRRSSRRSPSRSSIDMSQYPAYAVSGPLFSRIEAMSPTVKV